MKFDENKDLFLEEARELLAKIENTLLALEGRPENKELVNEVFRALHTIKGAGSMFGFTHVSEFTHIVENLFDEVRKGKLAINEFIIDIGLRSADCISLLLEQPDGGENQQKIIRDIESIGKQQQAPAQESSSGVIETQAASTEIIADKQTAISSSPDLPLVYRINFKPHPQILHRGVKLEPLFRELGELGICHVVAMTDEIPSIENLDPSAIHIYWAITLSTSASLAAIQSVFMFVEDYADLSITSVELQNTEGEAVIPKLGEVLINQGLMGAEEVEVIRQAQKPFGELAVSSGLVRKEQVEAALAEQSIVRTTNTERETRQESSTIRVRKEKLDNLIDLVGELVILHAILEQEAKKETTGIFGSISENMARLTADLRDTTMSIRMVPLEESFASFQRLVRDLSQNVGKELRLEISGASTELDKNIIESLKDPLVHIIRNSADHGIESPDQRAKAGKPRVGTISIAAQQVGARVQITIADDGAGLNIDKIRARSIERKLLEPSETDENRIMSMIFEPGFSTAEKTTGISGRGVGMDVVKRNIERLRGEITLQSEYGKGMRIVLSIPLTLVIIEGLLVRIDGFEYVVALSQVEECVDLTPEIQVTGNEEKIINLRGKTIPIVSLRSCLGIKNNYNDISRLVIVNNDGATVGLMVDAVVGRKQVVIKPMSSTVRRIKVISGATILGDGSVALILDVAEIVKTQLIE